jgi:hypothetical protein
MSFWAADDPAPGVVEVRPPSLLSGDVGIDVFPALARLLQIAHRLVAIPRSGEVAGNVPDATE